MARVAVGTGLVAGMTLVRPLFGAVALFALGASCSPVDDVVTSNSPADAGAAGAQVATLPSGGAGAGEVTGSGAAGAGAGGSESSSVGGTGVVPQGGQPGGGGGAGMSVVSGGSVGTGGSSSGGTGGNSLGGIGGGGSSSGGVGGSSSGGIGGSSGTATGGGGTAGSANVCSLPSKVCSGHCVPTNTAEHCGGCSPCQGAEDCTGGTCLLCANGCAVISQTEQTLLIAYFNLPFPAPTNLDGSTITIRAHAPAGASVLLYLFNSTTWVAAATFPFDGTQSWMDLVYKVPADVDASKIVKLHIGVGPPDISPNATKTSTYIESIRSDVGAFAPFEFSSNASPFQVDPGFAAGTVTWVGN